MDQLRNILATIQRQLGKLNATHKLLIASLAIIAVMVLFLVSQYAGKPSWASLMPGAAAEDVARAKSFLAAEQIEFREGAGGELLVRPAQVTPLRARLTLAGKLPADTTVMFKNIAESQNWMMSKGQLDQVYQRAVMNELCSIIAEFPGVRDARVIIDAPAQTGFGPSHKKPTAQVTVFTEPGKFLDQASVDALASLVAGSTAGLDPRAVQIIDGDKGRGYKVRMGDGLMDAGGTYLEQVAKVEQRVQEKIEGLLAHIGGVVVSVNAHVDVGQSQSRIHKVLPNKGGSETFVVREKSNTSESTQGSRGAAPGVLANTAMDVNTGGSSGNRTNEEDSETTMEAAIGREETTTIDPKGRPTKINVAVSVPRDWVAMLARQAKGTAAGDAEPTEAEVQAAWTVEQDRLTKLLIPMVEAPAHGEEKGVTAESVVVSMIPVPVPGLGGGFGGGGPAGSAASLGGGGAMASLGGLVSGGLIKTAALGGLAVVALGMMVMMVKKTSKPVVLPTAEELVGIPPALQAVSDLVGEASEGDTAMAGIEIDDSALKTKAMLEQVSDMVQKNPKDAATLFNRWLSNEA